MATRSRDRAHRPSHPPLWLVEGLDIVSRKRVLLAAVTAAVIVLGAIAALVLPELVPPTPVVGAAIGVAGLLLGLAAAVATDATDLVVRGPRHVAAAGGELVAVLPRDPSVAAAGPLAAAVLEVREPGVPLLLAFATASRDARRSSAWTDAIARSLVSDGVGVLRVDLASGRSEHPGLVEVVRDGTRLADAVTFEPGVKLAQLSAGRDHADALAALTELPGRLPRDLDIMLVSLPTAASRSVVTAATALDHVLIIVERDRTSRVDLIASLDALEAAGTHAQVVLLDTSTAMRLAPPVEVDPEAEAERRRTISSTVGTSPVVAPGSDGEPVPVPDDEPASAAAPDEEPAPPAEDATDVPMAEAEPAEAAEVLELEEEPPSDEVASSPDEDVGRDVGRDVDEEVDEGPDDAPPDEDAHEEPADAADAALEDQDEAGPPLGGPLAAGVAGAGVAAGLAAVGPAPEDDADAAAAAPAGDGGPEDEGEAAPDTRADQRDLELLEAAAAATAESIAAAEEAPYEPGFDEDVEVHDLEDELPQPGEPLVEELVELTVGDEHDGADEDDDEGAQGDEHEVDGAVGEESGGAPDDEGEHDGAVEEAEEPEPASDEPTGTTATVDDEVEQDDPTDRLAPVQLSNDPVLDPFDPADQDLLRTTAQLAILSDDLDLRGRTEEEGDVASASDPRDVESHPHDVEGDADDKRDERDERDERDAGA